MSIYVTLAIELIVGFFALFIITRFIRRTQINAITPFDFISGVVLGELLGNAIYDEEIGILHIVFAIFVWGLIMFTIEKITQKFRKTRKFFDGEPSMVIRNGMIDYEVLKRENLDLNELLSMLRQKDVFSVREVEYGILEESGALSILKKQKYDVPKIGDLNIEEKPSYLPIVLIMDSEVIWENLKETGRNIEWLMEELGKVGINSVKDVFYAEWKEDEGLHIVPKKLRDNKE